MTLAKALSEAARNRRELQRLKPRRTAGILTNFTTTGTTRRPNSTATSSTTNNQGGAARYA